jgi:cytochrome c oxidase subunit 2
MIGQIVAMSNQDYQRWLEQNTASGTLAAAGKELFIRFGCSGCHGSIGVGGNQAGSTVRAPPLAGLYGSPVPLADGSVITADERYLRDSILMPEKSRVASYQPLMPSFAGQVNEEQLVKLVAYITSLASEQPS